ncbi:RNA polymerase sigma factor, RpoD/SigA family [uncultured Nostoc sp.]|uniref:RNA polymerase sigma factor, RpoD/SigA family n=1 Tax=uncultured Nostoc sp. TaxID=340711 RepID=UPI0035C97DA5
MSNLTFSDTKASNTSKTSRSTNDTVHNYLQEIGRIPLLTQEQEILLSQQIQQMMTIIAESEKLAVELKRTPTVQECANQMQLSEQELLQQLNQGKKAKEKMIAANLRLVVSVAKKYQKRNLELMDLIQEGTLGLSRGIDKFNPALGYRFSTYAYWWIRQAITRALAQQGRIIRLPIHIHDKLNKIKRIQQELSQKLGHIPTSVEIANALSLKPSQVQHYMLLARQTTSLDIRIGVENETLLQDLIEDCIYSDDYHPTEEFVNQDVEILLSNLFPQQQEVLTLYFGLIDGHELSLEQIGQRMGISRERVRQIKKQALNFLQQRLTKSEANYRVNLKTGKQVKRRR